MRLCTPRLISALFVCAMIQFWILDCLFWIVRLPIWRSKIQSLKSKIRLFTRFSRFQLVILVGVSNALSFVCIGFAQAVQFRRDLAEFLPVDAGKRDSQLILI